MINHNILKTRWPVKLMWHYFLFSQSRAVSSNTAVSTANTAHLVKFGSKVEWSEWRARQVINGLSIVSKNISVPTFRSWADAETLSRKNDFRLIMCQDISCCSQSINPFQFLASVLFFNVVTVNTYRTLLTMMCHNLICINVSLNKLETQRWEIVQLKSKWKLWSAQTVRIRSISVLTQNKLISFVNSSQPVFHATICQVAI